MRIIYLSLYSSCVCVGVVGVGIAGLGVVAAVVHDDA